MKNNIVKISFLVFFSLGFIFSANAQRKVVKRNTAKKTTRAITKTKVKPTLQDTLAKTNGISTAANDSLPIKKVLPSLRPDAAVDNIIINDRTPLAYESLRADDALYRHKIWREIDAREKMNLAFRYAADEDNGNQRFISILLQAIQDSAVTVFNSIDDRFTTPMTKGEVAKMVAGAEVPVPIIDSNGVQTGVVYKRNEVNLDSFYKFRIKEEVIFDKEASKLFWRILGIAPLKRIITASGQDMGDAELFWVYYPDLRPLLTKYEAYNGKNLGGRMSWEELFESRMFYGRIIKSSIDNPFDLYINQYKGLEDKPLLQLMQGQKISESIFNYEQNLWSY